MDFNIFLNDGYEKKKVYQGVERVRDLEINKKPKNKPCCDACKKKKGKCKGKQKKKNISIL